VISEWRFWFNPLCSGKKCCLLQKLLMGTVDTDVLGAHKCIAASSSWSTSFLSMWWWTCCYFCGLEKGWILHMAVELGARMIKKVLLLRKNPWQLLSLTPHKYKPNCDSLSSIQPKCNLSPPSVHFLVGHFPIERHQSVQNPGTLEGWLAHLLLLRTTDTKQQR
jgi:hypothetical protein